MANDDLTEPAERLRSYLIEHRPGLIELLAELTEQSSFTGDRAGGRQAAAILARELLAAGLCVELRESERFAPHVLGASPPATSSAAGCIGLSGHLDTVFPPGSFAGFRRDGDVARGPGVWDMKGGLVVMLGALAALRHLAVLGRVPLRVVIVSDEEVGSPEGRTVIAEHLGGCDCALVLEPGRAGDAVITRRKGVGHVTVIAAGRAAHAGAEHRLGANAIWALSRFVDRAQQLTDYERDCTVSVGLISGGRSRNCVPDRAECSLDLRFVRPADGEQLLADLAAAARQAAASVAGTAIELHAEITHQPLVRTAATAKLLTEYERCARAAGLGFGEAPLSGGGSDANLMAAMGIAALDGLGPRGAHMHTCEELLHLDSLVPKAVALALFLLRRARPAGTR